MVNRSRGILLKFYVSEKELEQIRMKMEQYSTNNLSAYLRKIAIDGYVVNLELPELGEMVSLLRRSSNNLNQLTKRVHETGRFYIELRGIGLINVKELFGISAVKWEKSIDLIIKLQAWDGLAGSFDRLGLDEEYIEILGNKVLCNTIPIRPGRNVAVICESAAIANRQKKMGQHTAKELAQRLEQNKKG